MQRRGSCLVYHFSPVQLPACENYCLGEKFSDRNVKITILKVNLVFEDTNMKGQEGGGSHFSLNAKLYILSDQALTSSLNLNLDAPQRL